MKELRQTIKQRVAYWTIPPGFQSLIRQVLARRRRNSEISRAFKAEVARNIKFRDIHKGQRCFILATGPSINKHDLSPLKNENCIAVSMFFLHKDYREIDPLYHIFAPNHSPYDDEVPQKYLGGLNKVCSEKTTLFVGHSPYKHSFKSFLERNPEFKRDKIYYLNYCGQTPQIDENNYNNPEIWDISKAPFGIRKVTYSAIQIAAYMGFRKIYLLGVDMDYILDVTRDRHAHFYEDEKGIDDSALLTSTERVFLGYYMTWKQYRLIGEHLKSQGCYIYNATEGGILDVYPRVTLAEALGGE